MVGDRYCMMLLLLLIIILLCRLNTDVLFGKNFGMKTLAVLTGITDQQILDSASAELTPHYYADSIADAIKAKISS